MKQGEKTLDTRHGATCVSSAVAFSCLHLLLWVRHPPKSPEQLWSPIYLVNGSSSQHRYAQDDEVGTANLFFLDTFCCIRKTATLEAPRT